jgi:hypothetical protein
MQAARDIATFKDYWKYSNKTTYTDIVMAAQIITFVGGKNGNSFRDIEPLPLSKDGKTDIPNWDRCQGDQNFVDKVHHDFNDIFRAAVMKVELDQMKSIIAIDDEEKDYWVLCFTSILASALDDSIKAFLSS